MTNTESPLGAFHSTSEFPSLVGTAMDEKYTETVRSRLNKAIPNSVIKDFLEPAKLCNIWAQTILNFHPALYEAYGMTIIESAAFGVPSVVHKIQGNQINIGALELLADEECVPHDLTDLEGLVEKIRNLLSTGRRNLREIGERAAKKSLSYGEKEMGIVLAKALIH